MESLLCSVIRIVNCTLYDYAGLIFSRYPRSFLGSLAFSEIIWAFSEKTVTSESPHGIFPCGQCRVPV